MPLRWSRLHRERILQQFGLFTGLDPGEAMEWLPLCQEAALFLESRIRKGRLPPEAKALLESACGAEAAYRYRLAQEAGTQGGSFQIGDISVKERGGANGLRAAKQLRDEYFALAGKYLERDSPVFLSVLPPSPLPPPRKPAGKREKDRDRDREKRTSDHT